MRRPRFLITLIFLTIIVLSVVRVAIENSISTAGTELMALESTMEKYRRENSQLKERYLASSSLTRIANVAKEEGFTVAKSQVILSAPLPLALKP